MKNHIQIGDHVRITNSVTVAKQFHGLTGTVVDIHYTIQKDNDDLRRITGLEEFELILLNGQDCPRVVNELAGEKK